MVYKRAETAATCQNKQFQNNSLFSLPICQEEINKIIFVWAYKLENNFQSNNIELNDVNSVTKQEMESFPKEFLESIRTNWQIHIDQINTQRNAFITVQWVSWCSLYKSYMLQIYFTRPTRHPFFNFSFKNN